MIFLSYFGMFCCITISIINIGQKVATDSFYELEVSSKIEINLMQFIYLIIYLITIIYIS